MWELWMNLNYGHLYIPARNQHFSGEKRLLLCEPRFSGKKNLLQANGKKLILPLEKYFKIFKDMIIGTVGT